MSKYTLPKEYLSASQVSMYLRCGKQYEFRYIDNIVAPPGIAMIKGTAVHRGLEAYYKERMNGATPLTPTQVVEFCVMTLEDEAKTQELDMPGALKDQTIVEITNAASPYVEHVAHLITPVAVEQELRYEANCGVALLGYLDLVREPTQIELEANLPDENHLCDYKISGKKWSADKLQNDLQFNIYSLATGIADIEIHNMTPGPKKPKQHKTIPADYLADVQDITDNIRIVRNKFDGSEYEHVENIIENVAGGITKGVFMPCSPDGWVCSATWCGYWKLCRGKHKCVS
jgi:hypothetical protein